MAKFDDHDRQIVVRIVYDGAATAGKTTNLEQLTNLLTTSRRGELVVPERSRGRTLFFDWLPLQGGLIAGHRFRCELLTVPGQHTLRNRRTHILQSADVAVLVVDSRPQGLEEAAPILAGLRTGKAIDRPVPLVIQANKQDLPGALSPEDVAKRLEVDESIQVVGAQASSGGGVRDTALLAMRLAAMAVQEQLLGTGVSILPPADETPESLHAAMRLLRIEAQPERTEGTPSESTAATGPAKTTPSRPPACAERVPEVTPPSQAPAPSATTSATPANLRAPNASTRPTEIGEPEIAPPWPTGDVPSRHIWPAANGRDAIRALAGDPEPTICQHLMHKQGKQDGSGKPDTLIYRLGDHCLKTSTRRRFENVEAGEAALVDLARAKVLLGELLLPETVLVLQPDEHGGHWLWTVTPWTPSLRSDMAEAEARHSNAALGRALLDYAKVSFDALLLLKRHQLALDINPSNFARHDRGISYLDDDICPGQAIPSLGYAWLKRVDEYSKAFDVVEQYVSELESNIPDQLTSQDTDQLGLVDAIDQTMMFSEVGREAKRRLLAAAMRCR